MRAAGMPAPLFKLAVLLLLMVQGLIGVAPGRVLCIHLAPCCADHSGIHHHRTGVHDHGPGTCDDHPCAPEDAPGLNAKHDCACHVHLPVPGDEQVLNSKARLENTDLRTPRAVLAACGNVGLLVSAALPQQVHHGPLHPPDLGAYAALRSLKSTRLLI